MVPAWLPPACSPHPYHLRPCSPSHLSRAAGWRPPTTATRSSYSVWRAPWGRGCASWSSSCTIIYQSSTQVGAACSMLAGLIVGKGSSCRRDRDAAPSATPRLCLHSQRTRMCLHSQLTASALSTLLCAPISSLLLQSTACSAASCQMATRTWTAGIPARSTWPTYATTRVREAGALLCFA